MYLSIRRAIKYNVVIIGAYQFCQLRTYVQIFSNILLSRLTQYAEEIIGDPQCEFRRNRSTTDRIFSIRQILEKKMGTQRSSASALYRLQESLGFSWEGSLV